MNCPTCGNNYFGVKSPNIILVERNEELETENKRLREALESITELGEIEECESIKYVYSCRFPRLISTAKQALEE